MVLAQLEMGIPLFATISRPPGCSVPAEQCASRQGTTHCQVELLGIGGRGESPQQHLHPMAVLRMSLIVLQL